MAELRFCCRHLVRLRTDAGTLALLTLVLGSALLAGCTAGTDTPSSAPSTTPRMPLSLLVFNVEYGGTPATDHVITDVHADVVSVLESYNRLPEMAKAAGYPYYDVGLQILSKYPILEPSGANGLYAYIEVAPGKAVALINTHLDYVEDGPNRLARGVPVSDVLATEKRVRLASLEKLIPSATHLLGAGWPVLLTGDLNEPSHLDWTARTASQHGGAGPVDWPISEALLHAGLHDSYRQVHPDPVTQPGNTWGGVAGSNGSPRRIDYAYVGGPVDVVSSQVVGERGGDSVDIGYPKWTSDHRAVYSRLKVSPVSIPTSISLSSRMLTVGDAVTVTYQMPSSGQGKVVLRGADHASYDVQGSSGTLKVSTAHRPSGRYHVDLVDASGNALATNQFYVRPKNAHVHLSTDASTYSVGQPITVHWSDGPANRWDWIGVYRASAANSHKDDYLVWGYTGGHDAGALPPSTTGSMALGPDAQGAPWPLPPGRYVVHYLLTDQYNSVGTASFTVR